jgi:hypothetical protein
MIDILDTLNEIRDYLDRHADADHYEIGNGPIPNEAMRLMVELDEVIGVLTTAFGLAEKPDPDFDWDKNQLPKDSRARDFMVPDSPLSQDDQ